MPRIWFELHSASSFQCVSGNMADGRQMTGHFVTSPFSWNVTSNSLFHSFCMFSFFHICTINLYILCNSSCPPFCIYSLLISPVSISSMIFKISVLFYVYISPIVSHSLLSILVVILLLLYCFFIYLYIFLVSLQFVFISYITCVIQSFFFSF